MLRVIKLMAFGLFVLISFVFLQNGYNLGHVQEFWNLTSQMSSMQEINLLFRQFPPVIFIVFSKILENCQMFSFLDESCVGSGWIVYRWILFLNYWLSVGIFVFIGKTFRSRDNRGVNNIEAFVLSFSLFLIMLVLGYSSALAVPFILFGLYFLQKQKIFLAILFLIVAALTSYSVILLFPAIFYFVLRTKKFSWSVLAGIGIAGIIFFSLIFSAGGIAVLQNRFFDSSISQSVLMNLIYIFISPYKFFEALLGVPNREIWIFIWLLVVCIFLTVFMYNLLAIVFSFGRKTNIFMAILVTGVMGIFIVFGRVYLLFICIFIYLFTWMLKKTQNKSLGVMLVSTTICGVIFYPLFNESILLILMLAFSYFYLEQKSVLSFYVLMVANVLVFFQFFVFYGTLGLPPVRGLYFEFVRVGYGMFLIGFLILVTKLFIRGISEDKLLRTLKKFLVVFLVFVNISFITATGSSDTVSWAQYSNAIVKSGGNPFLAQTYEDQRYPPLSTLIMVPLTMLRKIVIGVHPTYATSNKLTVFIFYSLMIVTLVGIVNKGLTKKRISIDSWLMPLTVVSLIVQTQGFADFNVFTIPTFLLSVYFLFRTKRIFMVGLLFGITLSIKWQPVILLPLFCASFLNFETNILVGFRKLIQFVVGMFVPIIFFWLMVIINPGGWEAFMRAWVFLINGAPMLSGQALNLNWFVTYLIHYFQPGLDVSLTHLEGLNRQIPTSLAPMIFQGFFFVYFGGIVVWKYWMDKEKTFEKFVQSSMMVYFTHHILNKSAYEKHLFYVLVFALLYYLIRPNQIKRWLLVLIDLMTLMNLIFFFGFTGDKWVPRMFYGFDLTVLFSVYYVVIYFIILWSYLKKEKALGLSG
ncbi:hypothetical protein A2382_00695 [Candidatus Woesebacteria bacterium RIFOXYB1_FULL_38_16]|uniref:Uncharacterized protein n=1 Tax=Candidatus Woesebacteria bacterium RIFOXYB1_FULL_38_16 TaxID=1802538 RepID=A0A1F8CU69_9BACT|nr:MAG: hypothetical protein A2191_02845 [Candidatus Woesebacteria bacterium RIFOXYA1_FULL_38_9]OGM79288.1 MAG: hypothetical protein A2382_00695 [Candidatus Woesebacteria bacterium RIFOXYB1_FULL_38_16]